MSRVLITGAGGLIGKDLVLSQLDRGHQVRALDLNVASLKPFVERANLEIVTGDLTDSSSIAAIVAEVDVVYHLASAHLDPGLSDSEYFRVNVTATRKLLEEAQKAGVGRFVHCSSNGVFGRIERLPANEATPCRPTNIYERTKLLGEQEALAIFRKCRFPVVVARPSWVIGPSCPRTVRLMRAVFHGRFVVFGSGRTLRHPIYITDAVRGLELCALRGKPGEVYLLAGEKPVTVTELVETIASLRGLRLPSVRLPIFFGLAAAFLLQGACELLRRRAPFTVRTLDFFIKNNAYDISKARRELGFVPSVTLREGLEKSLAALPQEAGLESG